MNATQLIDALEIPADARVEQRVPKSLLAENGAPTTADRRRISEGVDELRWIAALKPTTTGLAPYQDNSREVIEIAVLCMTLRPGARSSRLTELLHRAVPYLVVLVTVQGPKLSISLANKRWSQADARKTVLDGEIVEARLDEDIETETLDSFVSALSLSRQSHSSLYALYQGWIDTVLALNAALVTGVFAAASSPDHAALRREALEARVHLESRIAALRAAAATEKQLPRQVELNLEIKRLSAESAAARARL